MYFVQLGLTTNLCSDRSSCYNFSFSQFFNNLAFLFWQTISHNLVCLGEVIQSYERTLVVPQNEILIGGHFMVSILGIV